MLRGTFLPGTDQHQVTVSRMEAHGASELGHPHIVVLPLLRVEFEVSVIEEAHELQSNTQSGLVKGTRCGGNRRATRNLRKCFSREEVAL